jgi:hypothetical protein
MKLKLWFFLLAICFLGCSDSVILGSKVDEEKIAKNNLKLKVQQHKELKDYFDITYIEQYYVTISIREDHFTFDPMVEIKDSANATSISIPTSKEFYDKIKVGTVLNDASRDGSFWIDGNIGRWLIKVESKGIKKVKVMTRKPQKELK